MVTKRAFLAILLMGALAGGCVKKAPNVGPGTGPFSVSALKGDLTILSNIVDQLQVADGSLWLSDVDAGIIHNYVAAANDALDAYAADPADPSALKALRAGYQPFISALSIDAVKHPLLTTILAVIGAAVASIPVG